MKSEARLSTRVEIRRPVRFVESRDRAKALHAAIGVNVSVEGVSLQSAVLPLERHERLELYLPVEGNRLVALEARQVWFGIEEEGDHPYWVKAGYRVGFKNAADEESFVRAYLTLGGLVSTPRPKNRVEYVF